MKVSSLCKGTILTLIFSQFLCISALLSPMCFADIKINTHQAGDYPFTEDSLEHQNVPKGKLEGPFEFHSHVFKGTTHRYWIYVPVGYNKISAKKTVSLLVFHDGQRAINATGPLRIPQVLDNLIYQKAIPKTLGIFITPGNLSEHYPDNLDMSNPNHRDEEYSSLSDAYSQFLLNELLPEASKQYSFSNNPEDHIIGGTSSGAIAAFTVAWNHPEAFHKVISIIGSYTSIGFQPATTNKPMVASGDLYPTLIRKSSIRPLRIFLQDGSNDINNEHGNWFLANQQMLSALQWANANADKLDEGTSEIENGKSPRYDINHAWGDGGHTDQHGGSLMPDILKWMFREKKN